MHHSLRYYKKYFCNIGQRHFIICKCKKHENAQDWMRQNYDPKKGLKNLDKMYNEIGMNHVQVNSVGIIKNQDPQPSNGLASIEELPAEDNDVEVINNEIQGKVNVNLIIVNRIPIGDQGPNRKWTISNSDQL